MDRTTIYHGPGIAGWDSETIHFNDDLTVKLSPDLFEVMTQGFGRVDKRRRDMRVEISGTPTMWPATPAKLLPYGSLGIGASIFGATDKPFVITPQNGGDDSGWTIANAAITSLPSITLAGDKPIFSGPATWTGILANNGDPSDLDDYIATSDAGALTGFDLTKTPTGLYTAAWGSVFTGIYSEEGFTIKPSLSTEDVVVNGLGTIDMIVKSLDATLSVTPIGMSAADILAALGDVNIGVAQAKNDFVITGGRTGMPIVTLKNTTFNFTGGRTGASAKRIGEIEIETIRTQTTGVIDALWTFASVGA